MISALDWFLRFGESPDLDDKTLRNILDPAFSAFAKDAATDEERAYVDYCIIFQKETRRWTP